MLFSGITWTMPILTVILFVALALASILSAGAFAPLKGVIVKSVDSGNDVDMFRGPVKGIIVGNRSAELADYETTKSIYVAKTSASEGILEGLKYYKIIK